MILQNMHTLTARRLLASAPSSRRQFHVLQTSRILKQTIHASPSMISARDYSTPTRSTAAANKSSASTPSPTQVTHQRKTDAPTISDRLSAEDSHKIEDWVLYHPVYAKEEVRKVKVVHFDNQTLGDKFASALVKVFRKGFDIVTGYKHVDLKAAMEKAEKEGRKGMSLKEMRERGLVMTPEQWLARCLFLESIAGVPGMCAAVLRHLRSLRLMRRDGGFIHDLLQEAENERMHLLSFMKMGHPSLFFRLMVLGAQGIFTNAFFFSYLISPRTCHRFVGKLEEEAVYTYTQCIEEIEAGRLPEWEAPAPRIAIDYWRLPENATILDMLYAIRTDEAGHRFYNHSIANLKDYDFNPFAIRKPSGELQGTNIGFTREQGLEWYEGAAKELEAVKGRRMNEEHIERSAKGEGGEEAKREGETPTFSTP